MSIGDGASYAPKGQSRPVVKPDEFRFAVAFLDHGHVYGQTNGLLEAGGTLTAAFDADPDRLKAFLRQFPQAQPAASFDALLNDPSLQLIASAAIPSERSAIGNKVMESGKDYFTDKSPFTTLEQLQTTRRVQAATGQRYFVYYAERIHNEAAWQAGELIRAGAIGQVLQVLNIAPHRLSPDNRPDWFFDKARCGGILTDIGSHQVEQFLTYAGCDDAEVNFARIRRHPVYPGLESFGEMSLTGNNDTSFYSRVDWYTPDGMPVWGDGRTFILGSTGSLEVRKYIDLNRQVPAAKIFLTDQHKVEEIDCLGEVGFPFFGQLIMDSLNGTDSAMSQAHIFKAAELSMQAQSVADQHGQA